MVKTTGKRVAIIGGGFGGLATGVKMAPFCKSIHVYDPLPIGKAGASSAAASLIHPFSPSGQLAWNGMENFRAAKSHFELVEKLSEEKFTFPEVKVIRTIFKPEDNQKWNKAYEKYLSDPKKECGIDSRLLTRLSIESFREYYQTVFPNQDQYPSIISAFQINPSMIIDSEKYLHASWIALKKSCSDCQWFQQVIDNNFQNLCSDYDEVIVAAGFGSPLLWKESIDANLLSKEDLPRNQLAKTHYDKGITIQLEADDATNNHINLLQDTAAFVFGDYLVPLVQNEKLSFIGGATHDRISLTRESIQPYLHPTEVDICNHHICEAEEVRLRDALRPALPNIDNMKTIKRRLGIRLKTANQAKVGRGPVIGRHPSFKNAWILTGFGVRGLLFHAYSADLLVQAILRQDESLIPAILHPTSH